jgi:hypothetical protein
VCWSRFRAVFTGILPQAWKSKAALFDSEHLGHSLFNGQTTTIMEIKDCTSLYHEVFSYHLDSHKMHF